jgi:hypothetical protein
MNFLPSAPVNLLLVLGLFICLGPARSSAANEPAEVKLEIRLIELERENKQVGFDYLGQVPNGTSGVPAAAPASVGVFPPQSESPAKGSKNVATLSGIMTDPQFRMIVRALEQRANAKTIAAPEGITLSGKPLVVKRPDGWVFQVTPETSASGRITMAVSLSQEKGEYAGFNLSSTMRVAPGEAAVFSDTFSIAAKKKGDPDAHKRLFLSVVPTLSEK